MEARAALLAGGELVVGSVTPDKPWPREVLVRTQASGVCHSELHHLDGAVDQSGAGCLVMGHEGAGIVEAVGDDVTTVRPGDHVVACGKSFCGSCTQCLSGHPNLCTTAGMKERPTGSTPRFWRDGEPARQFTGIGSHCEYMLLHENNLARIDDDIPFDRAAIVGCGVLTGVGAVLWTAKLHVGETAAVFGCGGVGLSAIQGARIGGARRIIAVDVLDSKLRLAERCGATDVVNAKEVDAVEAIRELTGGAGVDHSFEMVGDAKLVRQSIECLGVRGTATLVGILPAGASIEIPVAAIMPECKVQTSRMGSTRFRIEVPRYLELYKQGRLLLDELITGRGHLDDIHKAVQAMRTGESARTVLLFD